MKYKTFRTSMGHKVRMRMTAEEIAAQELYRIAIVVVPFVSTILLAAVWLGR